MEDAVYTIMDGIPEEYQLFVSEFDVCCAHGSCACKACEFGDGLDTVILAKVKKGAVLSYISFCCENLFN